MNGACPTCGKPIDPLRAPSVKVIAGKITAFCSPACAGRAQTNPALPVVPIAMVPAKESIQISAIAPEKSEAARTAAKAEQAKKLPPAQLVDETPLPKARRASSDDSLVDEPEHPPYDAPYDEPEDHEDDDAPAPPKRKRAGRRWGRVLLLTGALVASGAGIAILSSVVSPSHPKPADASSDHPPAPPPPAAETKKKPAHADPSDVYHIAEKTLGELLGSPSDRIRRVAAIGLARTGDKPAIDYLAKALESESSAINRIQDAFALARAGDKRGKDALTAGLVSPRRDVRSDAATDLLLLGDKAGASFMTDAMQLDQMKLSAAEVLARSGDAKAIAVLRAVLVDPKAPKESHIRALRALAYAGQSDVAAELEATLADKDASALSAMALARIGDKAAQPILEADLDVEFLRVDAAIALRRLAEKSGDKTLDPAIWADHLAPALAAGRDTDQASAGEAALILLGPSTLAEHE
ncbi:MAG TPA: HEAT repeat domain-containing protein [Kofleriaceae bacterium]|nr:HEAT repeat domain-containing protein [Kofleriaceae bacterium]